MEKEKIQKAVTDLRSLNLTYVEKQNMLANIMGGAEQNNPVHIQFWTSISWRTLIVRESWSRIAVVVALILMLAGGSVAFAAENTLPGDTLYPVKINITEPLRDTLAFSASAKAYLEELKIEKRIKEAAKLAARGRLTDSLNRELQKQIEAGVMRVGKLIQGK